MTGLWRGGGVDVKLTDEAEREAALALPGATRLDPGMGRPMRKWVHVLAGQSDHWLELEQANG